MTELFPSNSTPLIQGFGSLRASDIDSFTSETPDQNISKIEAGQKFQLRHYKLARLAALGCYNQNEIARIIGMTASRVSILLNTPSIQALIDEYRGEVSTEEIADYKYLVSIRDIALDKLTQDLQNDFFRGKDLVPIVSTLLDRTGLPEQKQLKVDSRNLNLNVEVVRQKHWEQKARVIEQTPLTESVKLSSNPLQLEEVLDAFFEQAEDRKLTLGAGESEDSLY